MAFDPNLPADHSPLSSAEMRVQLQGLKALIDIQQMQMVSLQQQLSPLMPVLSRTAGGQWTLAYAGPAQSIWQIWARYAGSEAWSDFGEISTSEFPAADDAMSPGGAWWQVKLCGEDGDGNQCTPFSNIISFGPVPT